MTSDAPSATEYSVSVDLLQPGVYIRLDGVWFKHPFMFSKFKIKNQKQIEILKSLGIREVICVPERSDRLPLKPKPLPAGEAPEAPAPPPPGPPAQLPEDDPDLAELWRQKNERIARLKQRLQAIERTEENYNLRARELPALMQSIVTGSVESMRRAEVFVGQMVDCLLDDTDAMVHLVNIRGKEENIFYHSLNVSVLALILGKQAGLSEILMQSLGLGALFHDLGKDKIPKKILKKETPLSKPELALLHQHPRYGVELLSRCGEFPPDAMLAVLQHHETLDGQGYPDGLKGEEITTLARITAIANSYDNLCNHPQPEKALTPYQALSYLYRERKSQLDANLLVQFVRSLGVYPPGTVVQLNNQALGLVVSVNLANPLKPSLLIYDPDIPKNEALILDMVDEPDLTVTASLHPLQLEREVFDYLNPRSRVTYFIEDREKPSGRA